jgi:transposase-like protein
MSHLPGTKVRYSESFKIRVVEQIEQEGLLISEARMRYGIKGGGTIQGWIRRFGKFHLLNRVIRIETMEEKDRVKQLEEENRKLKLALADSMLEKRCLQVLIEEVDKAYKTDVKKIFGSSASKG